MTYEERKAIRILSPRWILGRFVEIGIAFTLVLILTSHLQQREEDRFESIPATEWFEVTEVFVPDHEVGADPLVVYDRYIKRDFTAFWVVEVQRRDGQLDQERFFASCSGSGTNQYETTDYLEPSDVTWTWFIGRECHVRPGSYRLVVTYDMRVPEFDRVKRYKVLSNVFQVYAPGTMSRTRTQGPFLMSR